MKYFFLLLLPLHLIVSAASNNFVPGAYNGKGITPALLLELAKKMPQSMQTDVNALLKERGAFITALVTTPHPLTREKCREKTQQNNESIAALVQAGKVESLSDFNYVLRFKGHEGFSVPINRWGSRIAYWVYASGQGSVLDPTWDRQFSCEKIEYLPSFQHCSRAAHYVLLDQVIKQKRFKHLRTTPTYLQHLPGKPKELSDEHYVVVQEWVPGLKELKHLPESKRAQIRERIPQAALAEIHQAIVHAALWDMGNNLAIVEDPDNEPEVHQTYYMVDLEEPFNHKPQFFFFQGTEGQKKYTEDVIDGLERMAKHLLPFEQQFDRWQKLTKEDAVFNALCAQHGVQYNFSPEHLKTKD